MSAFPPSEWLVHGRDEVLDSWVKELRAIDSSKPLRTLIATLKALEGRLLVISEPYSPDDDDDENADTNKLPPLPSNVPALATPDPVTTSIKSQRAMVPARASELDDHFANDPKVSE
jgi:hypothetical protein